MRTVMSDDAVTGKLSTTTLEQNVPPEGCSLCHGSFTSGVCLKQQRITKMSKVIQGKLDLMRVLFKLSLFLSVLRQPPTTPTKSNKNLKQFNWGCAWNLSCSNEKTAADEDDAELLRMSGAEDPVVASNASKR